MQSWRGRKGHVCCGYCLPFFFFFGFLTNQRAVLNANDGGGDWLIMKIAPDDSTSPNPCTFPSPPCTNRPHHSPAHFFVPLLFLPNLFFPTIPTPPPEASVCVIFPIEFKSRYGVRECTLQDWRCVAGRNGLERNNRKMERFGFWRVEREMFE